MPRTLDQIRMTLRGNDDTGYAVVDADTGEVLAKGPLDKKAGISAVLHAGLPTLWLQNVDQAGVPLEPPILYMKVTFTKGPGILPKCIVEFPSGERPPGWDEQI